MTMTETSREKTMPADAFDLVVPSIPGYGFSGPTQDRGWNVRRIAQAWDELSPPRGGSGVAAPRVEVADGDDRHAERRAGNRSRRAR